MPFSSLLFSSHLFSSFLLLIKKMVSATAQNDPTYMTDDIQEQFRQRIKDMKRKILTVLSEGCYVLEGMLRYGVC